jgi:hypothetical protein
VGTDLEHIDIDAELVERLVEVQMVRGKADHADGSARIDVRLVGLRHQEVLLLRRVAAEGQHLLAARAKRLDRSGDRLELGEATAREVLGVEHQYLDAIVGGRRADRIDQVAHQRLGLVISGQRADRALPGTAGQLLDQTAFGTDEERRLRRHERQRLTRGDQQHGEDREQQQQVQDLAQAVEHPPQQSQQPTQPRHTHPGTPHPHGRWSRTSVSGRTPRANDASRPRARLAAPNAWAPRGWAPGRLAQTFSSIRADLPERSRRK